MEGEIQNDRNHRISGQRKIERKTGRQRGKTEKMGGERWKERQVDRGGRQRKWAEKDGKKDR